MSSLGMATQVLLSKSATLKVPVIAVAGTDPLEVDPEVGQHVVGHAGGAAEGRPRRRRLQVLPQREQRHEPADLEGSPPVAQRRRLHPGQQHAEGEDAARGAVAVIEAQAGLVEGLHHAGLPCHSHASAGHDQRPLHRCDPLNACA